MADTRFDKTETTAATANDDFDPFDDESTTVETDSEEEETSEMSADE